MSRSSYGNPPKGPNKGSAGTPHVQPANESPTAPTVQHVFTTPDRHQAKTVVTPGTKAGGNKPGAPNKPSGGF
jgi:hypothetical protein